MSALIEFKVLYPILLVVSLSITYVLHRKGKLTNLKKTEMAILVALGVILPFVDVVETWIGFEYEMNPLVIASGWPIFIIAHVAMSFLAFIFGWFGRSQEQVVARVFLVWLVIACVIAVIWNFLALKSHGFF